MAEPGSNSPPTQGSARHVFVRTLGAGRYAEVTCVMRQGPAGFRRLVALKRPHRDDPVAVERLLREARVGGLLRHESIVATLDVERDEEGWYLVLEYVDGPTLATVLASTVAHTQLPAGAVFELVESLLSALAYAHAAQDEAGRPLQLVHGDLSPANVLLTQKGQLKVADFGGAASTVSSKDSSAPHARSEGRGTPGFGAPEVSRGEPLDRRADVYSAGAIARELFARTELRDDDALAAVLGRATAAARDARYSDVLSFAAALAPFRPIVTGELGLDTLAAGWVKQLATQPASVAPAEALPPLPVRPYRGLDSFGPDSAALFFGRRDDAGRLARRIRTSPIVVLTGASGAGKSSLLAAGIPEHLADFAVLRFRPGPDPSTRLARLLGVSREDLAGAVAPASSRALLTAPTLLIVDQAEELLTLASPSAAVEACAALVGLVAADTAKLAARGSTKLVFSVRADHLAALCDLEPLRGAVSVELLSSPSRQQMVAALEKPLEPFGYRFESHELVERIVSALIGRPGALALLQFTADQLWDRRDQEHAVLRASDLEALGGVEGAITTYADRVLDSLAPAEQQVARRILVRCLEDGARHPLAVPALLSAEWAGGHASEVLERLVEARLLTRRADPEEGAVVEPAHEALVSHWGTLARWVTENSLAQQLLGELLRATDRWTRGDRRDELLWTAGWLARWSLLESELDEHVGPGERHFIEVSLRYARRKKRRRVVVVVTAAAVLLSLALLATWGWRQAAGARDDAEFSRRTAELETLLSRSAEHRERGETGKAVALAREVLRAEPRSAKAIAALYAAVGGRSELVIMTGHGDTVRDSAFTPDGAHILTAGMDGTVRIWNREVRLVRAVEPELGPIYRLEVGPKSDRFSVVGASDTVRIYRIDGDLLATFDFGTRPNVAVWDPTGEQLLVAGGGRAAVFDGSGAFRHDLLGSSSDTMWSAFSPDGTRTVHVSVNSKNGTILSANGSTTAFVPLLYSDGVAFSPDPARDRFIVAAWPSRAQLFDGQGRELARVNGEGRYPVAVWSRDGSRFFAGAPDDEGAFVAMSADGDLLATFSGHQAPIHTVAAGEAGMVASADERGEIRVFSSDGDTIAVLDGHAGRVWSLAFSPDGANLLSAAEDGTARLWDTRGRSRARLLPGVFVQQCPIDAQGERVLALTRDSMEESSELRLFSVSGDLLAFWSASGTNSVKEVLWRPDGQEAVAIHVDGTVEWLGRNGKELGKHRPSRPLLVVAWQGQTLVGGTKDGRVISLERSGVEVGVEVLEGPVNKLAMTDRRGVAAGPGGLAVFDLARSEAHRVDARPSVRALCWSPDETRFAVGHDSGLVEIRDDTGRVIATLSGHRERVMQCAWHPSSARMATAGWDGEARVWSRDGALLEVYGGHRREVGAVTWSPDGTRLLTTDWSGVASLRDERGTLARFSGHGGELVYATFATHAPLIATCGRNGRSIHLWPADDHTLGVWADALVPEAMTWPD